MQGLRWASRDRLAGAVAAVVLLGVATGTGCFFTPGESYPGGPAAIDPGDEPQATCIPGATEGCYSGPRGTEGQGICRGGTRTCSADGQWGACEGEVLPAEEVCGDGPVDQDCNGFACPGEVVWAIAAGGIGTQEAFDIAVDREGNVLIGGGFKDELTLGGTTYVSDDSDGFLVKLSADGELLWVRQLGGKGDQTVHGVAVDDAGNAYITGSFSLEMLIGMQMTMLRTDATNDLDLFVAKFDAMGGLVWAADYGTGEGDDERRDQVALDIAVEGEDNAVITGWFRGAMMYDDMNMPISSADGQDVFVAGIGAGGSLQWFSKFGDGSGQVGRAIALGSAAYVVGDGSGVFDVVADADPLSLMGDEDILSLGIDKATGNPLWAFNFSPDPDSHARGLDVVLTPGGDLLFAGHFRDGRLDLGGGTLPSVGPSRFVTKRKGNGEHVWSRGFSAMTSAQYTYEVRMGIATDAFGNVLLAGEFTDSVDFGGGPLFAADPNTTTGDIFVTKLDPNGAHLWSRRFGDAQAQFAYAVAAAPTGHAVVTGNFRGQLDFDASPLTANSAGADLTLFIAKLAP